MPRKGKYWVVTSGENLESIAGKIYGNQRMFIELSKMNGGVRNLRPGMVLRLPANKKNEDIFVSNNTAAYQGMATSQDLQDFYANNPGQSATAAMNSGAWQPGFMGATGGGAPGAAKPPAQNPIKPFVNSNAAAPFSTPYGMQNNGAAQPVTPLTSDMYRRQAGNAGAMNVPGPKPVTPPSWQGTTVPTGGTSPIANTLPPIPARPQGQQFPAPQKPQDFRTPTNPLGYQGPGTTPNAQVANVATGTLPPGAQVGGTAQKPASGTAPNGAKVLPTTPQQAYGLNPNYPVAQTALNTNPEVMAYAAPYVKDALTALYFSAHAPEGMGTVKKSQVDMLVQAGLLVPGTQEYEAAYLLASGGTPKPYGNGLNAGGTVGKWEPYATPNGKKEKPPRPIGGGGRGGGGGFTYWLGSGYGKNIGPTLGLMNWRINL